MPPSSQAQHIGGVHVAAGAEHLGVGDHGVIVVVVLVVLAAGEVLPRQKLRDRRVARAPLDAAGAQVGHLELAG